MGKSKNAGQSVEGFLTAAYDQLGDLTYYHSVCTSVRMLPTKRRGVFKIEVSAYRQVPNSLFKRVASYSIEYPNAAEMNFGAQLFAAVNQLDRLLNVDNPERAISPVSGLDQV